jgi:hypothetical protein
MRGNLAGGGWMLLFGNPTQNSGQFFRSFHEESDTFEPIHVSSEETPNITGREPSIRGLAAVARGVPQEVRPRLRPQRRVQGSR